MEGLLNGLGVMAAFIGFGILVYLFFMGIQGKKLK